MWYNLVMTEEKLSKMPQSVKVTLWSYDTDRLDLEKSGRTVIGQVLNYGSTEAWDWLFSYYGRDRVREEAARVPKGAWNKPSLALWSLVLDIQPKERSEWMKISSATS
ncbi:MAG: hypothetical protein AAB360_00580 [Patescibacteria group bacterium]